MNTRTRTLQRMKKRASGSHVPKDYKELGERLDKKLEHIEKGLDQLHRHIDERLDRMVNFLHEIDERTRKTSDVSVWDIKQEHALRRSQTLCKGCLSSRVYPCMHRLFESLRAALRRAAVSDKMVEISEAAGMT